MPTRNAISVTTRRFHAGSAAVAAAAAGIVVLLAACSGQSSTPGTSGGFNAALCPSGKTCPAAPSVPADAPSPSAAESTLAGSFATHPADKTAITDPAYIPVVQQSGSVQPFGIPAVGMLPAGWDPDSWEGDVVGFTGQSVPTQPSPNPNLTEWWSKTTAQVPKAMTVLMARTSSGNPTMIECTAEGFDPKDDGARSQVLALMSLCVSADFPGSEPSEAKPWVARQVSLIFNDLAGMTTGQHLACATPIFGRGVYELSVQELAGKDPLANLFVYGSASPSP